LTIGRRLSAVARRLSTVSRGFLAVSRGFLAVSRRLLAEGRGLLTVGRRLLAVPGRLFVRAGRGAVSGRRRRRRRGRQGAAVLAAGLPIGRLAGHWLLAVAVVPVLGRFLRERRRAVLGHGQPQRLWPPGGSRSKGRRLSVIQRPWILLSA
jgi:hypothetical protein